MMFRAWSFYQWGYWQSHSDTQWCRKPLTCVLLPMPHNTEGPFFPFFPCPHKPICTQWEDWRLWAHPEGISLLCTIAYWLVMRLKLSQSPAWCRDSVINDAACQYIYSYIRTRHLIQSTSTSKLDQQWI